MSEPIASTSKMTDEHSCDKVVVCIMWNNSLEDIPTYYNKYVATLSLACENIDEI
jgi:hypothetical protein